MGKVKFLGDGSSLCREHCRSRFKKFSFQLGVSSPDLKMQLWSVLPESALVVHYIQDDFAGSRSLAIDDLQ